MPTSAPASPSESAFSADTIEVWQNVLLWSIWAQELALDTVVFSVADLALEIRYEPQYAAKLVEIYKMLLVERNCAPIKERTAEQAFQHLRAALLRAGRLPSVDPLAIVIDFDLVPRCCGYHSVDINTLRPQPQRSR